MWTPAKFSMPHKTASEGRSPDHGGGHLGGWAMAGGFRLEVGNPGGYGVARARRSSDFRPIQAVLRYSRSPERFTAWQAHPYSETGKGLKGAARK